MKPKLRFIVPALALVLAGGMLLWKLAPSAGSGKEVNASGTIEVTETRLSFKISGRLAERLVDEGQQIEAGQLLAQLDPTDQRLQLERARSELAAAQARLAELEAGSRPEERRRAVAVAEQQRQQLDELRRGSRIQEIAEAEAEQQRARAALAAAESQAEQARADEQRFSELFQRGVVSRREQERYATAQVTAAGALDEARARLRAAEQRLSLRQEGSRAEQIRRAQAALSAAEADRDLVQAGPRQETIAAARAQVAAAQVAVAQAEELLGYTRLVAPLPGVVLSKSAEPGEYLTPGAPVLSVGNLDDIWLRAYIAETDLGRIKLGQSVEVRTDATAGKAFTGHIGFIASEAEFTPKAVQTAEERVKLVYRIKVALENPDHLLKPGMPADLRVPAAER